MRRARRAPLPDRDGIGPTRVRLRGGKVRGWSSPSGSARGRGESACRRSGLRRRQRRDRGRPCYPAVRTSTSTGSFRSKPSSPLRSQSFTATTTSWWWTSRTSWPPCREVVTSRRRPWYDCVASLSLPELSPAHRLDRLTAGVLLFTARREVRGAYQTMFARGEVSKTYLARAGVDPVLEFPLTLRSRIIKQRSHLQAAEEPGEPNAETVVDYLGDGVYRLTPKTGRTHQLRVHMASLGLPIINDSLYPNVIDVASDDFSLPLQLLAHTLAFDDPLRGGSRVFVSARTLGRTVAESTNRGECDDQSR